MCYIVEGSSLELYGDRYIRLLRACLWNVFGNRCIRLLIECRRKLFGTWNLHSI